MSTKLFLFLLLFFFMIISRSFQNGMRRYLCEKKMNYNSNRAMLDLCYQQADYYGYSIVGFRNGIKQCKTTFRHHRWNCTTQGKLNRFKLFGTAMMRGSAESAFMMAMVSAGIAEQITSEIQQGNRETGEGVPNPCNQPLHLERPEDYVASSDCDEDLKVGSEFAERLIRNWQPGSKSSSEAQMNFHNAAVGRLAVKLNMQKVCRCIGLSGACHAQCCYRTLRPLSVTANWLKTQYDKAVKVTTEQRYKRDGSRLLVHAKTHRAPEKTDLIYLLDSPSYCLYNPLEASLGTKGRTCDSKSNGTDNCDKLCCYRGYSTHLINRVEPCRCKFHWCCTLKCEKCKRKYVENRCK